MNWSDEAEKAVSRVPFFVRGRVKKRVEEEAANAGAGRVELTHVEACRRKFLKSMDDEVKGHVVETCFGPSGCPNRVSPVGDMAEDLENLLAGHNLREFLKKVVGGPLKMHHQFKVGVSDCPNACSRPQIADIGLIGAQIPVTGDIPCTGCGTCASVCSESAVTLAGDSSSPIINRNKCLGCGQCVMNCPSGTLIAGQTGYRVQLGGKLGRRPRLALELPGIYSHKQALDIAARCVEHFKKHNRAGERFGEIIERTGLKFLSPLVGEDPK